MSIKQRVEEFTKFKKISIRKFESACGLSNGYFSGLKNAIGRDKMEAITRQYPELNPVWLMMGEGSMLRVQYKIERQNDILNETHFEQRSIDSLSRALDRLSQMYEKAVLENDDLKDEIENLKKVASAQKTGA